MLGAKFYKTEKTSQKSCGITAIDNCAPDSAMVLSVVSVSTQRPGFSVRPVHVGLTMNKVFLTGFRFSPVRNISQMLHTHISFMTGATQH
jgi:hypothetical protein